MQFCNNSCILIRLAYFLFTSGKYVLLFSREKWGVGAESTSSYGKRKDTPYDRVSFLDNFILVLKYLPLNSNLSAHIINKSYYHDSCLYGVRVISKIFLLFLYEYHHR